MRRIVGANTLNWDFICYWCDTGLHLLDVAVEKNTTIVVSEDKEVRHTSYYISSIDIDWGILPLFELTKSIIERIAVLSLYCYVQRLIFLK